MSSLIEYYLILNSFMKAKKLYIISTRIFSLILMITVGYLFLTGSRYSKLVGYFVYMSIACLIIPLPSPPYVIGMGKIFHPGIVAIVGSIGSCIAVFFEYHVVTWIFSKSELQQKVEDSSFFQKFSRFLIVLHLPVSSSQDLLHFPLNHFD